jgi:hypothetical protein
MKTVHGRWSIPLVVVLAACGGSTVSSRRAPDGGAGEVNGAAGNTAAGGNVTAGGTNAAGGGSGTGGTTAAGGNTATGGTEEGGIGSLSCSQLAVAWRAYKAAHVSCSVSADCGLFSAYDKTLNPCDGPPGLDAVLNTEGLSNAAQFAARYESLSCGGPPSGPRRAGQWSDFSFDGTALQDPQCKDGTCMAVSRSCNPPP